MIDIDDEFTEGLFGHFKVLKDPRVSGRCRYDLAEKLVVAVCAVIFGATSWVEMEEFGDQQLEWFRRYFPLKGGVPSHDTFARVFSLIDPSVFESNFTEWVRAVVSERAERVCIDD